MYVYAKSPREQLLKNNHKHLSIPKVFSKNKDTPKNTGFPQETISFPRPKLNSFLFYDPYDNIHHMDHTHENTHIIYTQSQDIENNEVEKE